MEIMEELRSLYGAGAAGQSARYRNARDCFVQQYGREPQAFFSVPGRSELGGNHTDHQNGRVLTAAVDLDSIAAVCAEDGEKIRILSEGYEPFELDLVQKEPLPEEAGTSVALVRGIGARMAQLGHNTGGFSAYITSDVLPGSGLSSSASFEVLTATILNHLYNGGSLGPVETAKIGQYAENEFFKKPCGLQDQMACALGGVSYIDFLYPDMPLHETIPFDLERQGYALCIVNTAGAHCDLTAEYASIPQEMMLVAKKLGHERLGHCDPQAFFSRLPELRAACGDRAVLRAYHFFAENERPEKMAQALRAGDFTGFLNLVNESGRSSHEFLQNISAAGRPQDQPLAIALALSEKILGSRGAWRVHGGGFAGTIQAYIPEDLKESYRAAMEPLFGRGCCFFLTFRYTGPQALRG